MNLLRNGLLMRKTEDPRRTKLTEESASQCGFSAEFITASRAIGNDKALGNKPRASKDIRFSLPHPTLPITT